MPPRVALQPDEIARYRKRLTEVASGLFAERGYEGVTLRAIAAELGCSPMTPYRYFRDKREIFSAVRTAAYERFARAQERALASATNPLERLVALGRSYVDFGIEQPDAYRLMFELSQPHPGRFPAQRVAETRAWEPIRSTIADVIYAGVLEGDPDTVAHVFWASMHGIVSLHLARKLSRGRTIEDLWQPLASTLVRGNRPERKDSG
jgi:AcrR family transcriptional regulator